MIPGKAEGRVSGEGWGEKVVPGGGERGLGERIHCNTLLRETAWTSMAMSTSTRPHYSMDPITYVDKRTLINAAAAAGGDDDDGNTTTTTNNSIINNSTNCARS